MRLVKHVHSCVALEHDGRRLVVDPGSFGSQDVLTGAHGLLVTHGHVDHLDVDAVRAALADDPVLELRTTAQVADALGVPDQVHVVGPGDSFTTAGFDVRVLGEHHAPIHPEVTAPANVGFLVTAGGTSVFHPGDALTVPDVPVDVLLVPVFGPWTRMADLVDWIRAVHPDRAIAIHDAGVSDGVGQAMVTNFLGDKGPGTGVPFVRVPPGTVVPLP
ncbi:MBL fold metallo-hydrolase [Actinotalea solisilvae]|uniref:MBL fold metallo-hydrolase n=1 Tax=Actinotalea solisilvae TaxID=2072922 RepID=UPI0018F21E6D|nr:MBL fold metallo-hydrolase [Actinotalea solisilvae]